MSLFLLIKEKKAMMNKSDLYLLAEKIATEILTVSAANGLIECTRVQLMLRQEDGTERNMGGRNKASLIEAIERNLRESQ